MRGTHSAVWANEITRNPWVWAALALCSVLLVAPPYIPPIADVLHLAPPTAAMWAIILGLSLAPLLVIQAVTLMTAPRQPRS